MAEKPLFFKTRNFPLSPQRSARSLCIINPERNQSTLNTSSTMKTNVKVLALAAALLAVSAGAAPFAHAATPGTVEPKDPAEAAVASLTVASYRAANANSLRVFVQKATESMAWVKIKNAAGQDLFEQGIARHATGKAFKFDLSELPAGHYTVEVSNRQKKVVTAFNVKPAQPVVAVR